VVAQLRPPSLPKEGRRQRVAALSALMDELGYDARVAGDVEGAPAIEADNCVFHEIAQRNPEVCHFDLALLSGFTDSKVQLHECMARGGHVCRFRFTPRG
jgi:predicted ArsR family transcriptional regulator